MLTYQRHNDLQIRIKLKVEQLIKRIDEGVCVNNSKGVVRIIGPIVCVHFFLCLRSLIMIIAGVRLVVPLLIIKRSARTKSTGVRMMRDERRSHLNKREN